jgi:hypothetical protein
LLDELEHDVRIKIEKASDNGVEYGGRLEEYVVKL